MIMKINVLLMFESERVCVCVVCKTANSFLFFSPEHWASLISCECSIIIIQGPLFGDTLQLACFCLYISVGSVCINRKRPDLKS